ncbi:MAG: hypothetical protein EPN89_06195 [Methylovulum sp.]|nr:MAG: hypothetical protein EPN89_06195 [Methylovulum sp.]
MKILFFLVAIANVTLLMWEYKTGKFAARVVSAQQTAAGKEAIVLLAELKPASPVIAKIENIAPPVIKAAPESPSPKKPEAIPVHCYEAGPFTHQAEYQHWLSAMTSVYAVNPASKDERAVSRYIVSSPANTPKETDATVQLLKKHGISDFFMRRTEAGDKEISLGIFSSEERAAIMQQQMLTKGINVKIKAEYKIKPQKYLLIRVDNNSLELLAELRKSYPRITVKNSECR